jgi:hypothetical protein
MLETNIGISGSCMMRTNNQRRLSISGMYCIPNANGKDQTVLTGGTSGRLEYRAIHGGRIRIRYLWILDLRILGLETLGLEMIYLGMID